MRPYLAWFAAWCVISAVDADYQCVCNYDVEKEVYDTMTVSSDNSLGYMYEFDCKEQLEGITTTTGWIALAYEHKVGYIQSDENTKIQTCPGDTPTGDKVIPPSTSNSFTSTKAMFVESSTQTTELMPTTTTTELLPSTPMPSTTVQPIVTSTLPPETTAAPTTTTPPTTTTTTVAPTTTTTEATTPTPTTPKPITTTTASTTPAPTTPTTAAPTMVPTTTTTSATTPMPSTASPVQSTTTSKQAATTSQQGIISGNTDLCPVAIKSFTAHDGGILTQYDKKCYEVVPRRVSWTYAERDCKGKGGNLVQIKSADEQAFIYKYLHDHYNHNVWIGLHDGNHEGHFEWDADPNSDPPVYTNWQPGESHNHQVDDCVYLRPQDGGHWHDGQCSGGFFYTHAYICQYETDASAKLNGTINPHGDGNTHLCPSNVQRHASRFHGTLGQYEKSCYEVLPRYKVTWSHGEQLCKQEGGHLAHIRNAEEQKFIQEFMTNHLPDHAVWIGLNDRQHENTFVWSSGEPVTYTNWVGGHEGNFVSHYQEDCALFIPYQKGQWDDLPCGTHAIILGDFGETHPILCQFDASVGPAIIG